MYSIVKFPYGIALWVAAASMGPALGPVMGGFAAEAKTWRWPLWIQVWLCAPVLVIMVFCLPETSAANILVRRARRLRKITGSESLRCKAELEQSKLTFRTTITEGTGPTDPDLYPRSRYRIHERLRFAGLCHLLQLF